MTPLFLIMAGCLAAQSEFTLKTDAMLWRNGSGLSEGYTAQNRLTWERAFSPWLNLRLGSDLYIFGRTTPSGPHEQWHNGEAELSYRHNGFTVSAAYRNRAFFDQMMMNLYPAWAPSGIQERHMQHKASLEADYESTFFQAGAYAQAKQLDYTPYMFDFSTFEFIPQPAESAADVYYGAETRVRLMDGLSARVSAHHKDGLFAEEGTYRLTQISGGLDAEYQVFGNTGLQASFNWTNRSGSSISEQRRNLVQTALRLHDKLTPDLAAALTYVNNSLINEDLSELYLLSNYLRAHLQYSFPSDPSGGSYLLLGGKYSPENKASAAMLEGDYRVWGRLYAGLSINYQPDRKNLYSGKVSYFFTPLNEVHVQYTYRDFTMQSNPDEFIGIGSSVYW